MDYNDLVADIYVHVAADEPLFLSMLCCLYDCSATAIVEDSTSITAIEAFSVDEKTSSLEHLKMSWETPAIGTSTSFLYNDKHIIRLGIEHTEQYSCYLDFVGINSSAAISVLQNSRVEGLNPHIVRATRMRRAILEERQLKHSLFTLSHSLPFGMIGLGSSLQVLFKNECARRILTSTNGLSLIEEYIYIDIPSEQERYEQAIQKSTMGGHSPCLGESVAVLLNLCDSNLPIVCSPIKQQKGPSSSETDIVTWLYLLPINETLHISHERLQANFSLTPAESLLVNHVVNAGKILDHAANQDISLYTAKNQLAAIFKKMNCGSQEELLVKVVKNLLLPDGFDETSGLNQDIDERSRT